ncbi:MATE family efflux transporter [Methanobrevibacter sp. DSM 116169]|uniref:MATE family efflux transporter n=1 Tax=Methanobrevibacter sp. DSM 116169 TaxID=3242727 RepID=UPI0038FCF39F
MNTSPGVKLLLGEPKKAILEISKIAIIAMFISSLYSVVDLIWASGISETALTSIGFVNPIYLGVIAIANGFSYGASTIISKYIGLKDKNNVNNSSIHILIIIIILSIFLTVFLNYFLKDLILITGGESVLESSLSYGNILFSGTILIVFVNTTLGIFRGEANSKKAIIGLAIGLILNIILDPLFIYIFNLGINGSAIATLISLIFVSVYYIYLLLKNSYIDFNLRYFKLKKDILNDILKISLPTSLENLFIPILYGFLNYILILIMSQDGVAIFNVGWQILAFIMSPIFAIGMSMVSLIAVNYSKRNFKNILLVKNYVLKISIIIAIALSILIFILSPYIGDLFVYSSQAAQISDDISYFLKVTCIYYVFLPFGISASYTLKGLGHGFSSLIVSFFNTVVCQGLAILILVFLFNFDEKGIWYGIIIGNSIGSIISFTLSNYYINKLYLKKEKK